jgi:hypothetical protein
MGGPELCIVTKCALLPDDGQHIIVRAHTRAKNEYCILRDESLQILPDLHAKISDKIVLHNSLQIIGFLLQTLGHHGNKTLTTMGIGDH